MEDIIGIVVGIVCIILGILNRKGNISFLHSYHTKRVAEEDKIPFGKMVGNGTIIIGVALILFRAFAIASIIMQNALFTTVGTVVMIVGLVVGLGFCFYAMFKYNKGVF